MNDDLPPAGPPRESFDGVFHVTGVRTSGDEIFYFGQPLVAGEELVREVWPAFRDADYEVQLARASQVDVPPPTTDAGSTAATNGGSEPLEPNGGSEPLEPNGGGVTVDGPATWGEPTASEYVLVARPLDLRIDGIPWKNVILFVATVLSTLYAGTLWYHIDWSHNWLAALQAWPFSASVMGVLLTHELGHYVMSRYHGVRASLPYFIPLPLNPIMGTMGAVIWMKGQMPDRDALFDIGVAGPLAGLVATVVVTVIGLFLSPVPVPPGLVDNPDAVQVYLGFPPLLKAIAWATGQSLTYGEGQAIHPIVIGGWVGMFVTFLNMIPVGQLDGGHVLRAILGGTQETVAKAVPVVLFALSGYLYFVEHVRLAAISIWAVWGVFALILVRVGPAHPIDDDSLGPRRTALGVLTVILGLLCFTPVPVNIVP